ncbi:MAG: hypothetical protein J5548_13750 [Prevotella sp.]|nr:hypothetical protein [Prevotella sp.]
MIIKFRPLVIFSFLCAVALNATAQSFDLRPTSTSAKKANEQLEILLDNNDVDGMEHYLKKNANEVNSNSRVLVSENRAKTPIPLFVDAVYRVLNNIENGSVEMCQAIIDAGCDLHPVFEGTTPIYMLMKYFATHKKSDCEKAMKLLKAFATRSDWDANLRYRSELPPLNYLLNTNYNFLGEKFSKEYIANEVLETLISHGASVTTYSESGSSLMAFALETDNEYLQSYFLSMGVNLKHSDDGGNDDIYKMIASNKLSILKEVIAKGKLDLNINNLKNDPKEISKNREMYDFVADVCASKVASYEDVVLFRQKFADKKQLTQQKYEELARREVNACTTYDMITNCVKRYPDLPDITGPKLISIAEEELKTYKTIAQLKLFETRYPQLKEKTLEQKDKVYKADCIALQEAYSQMKASMQNKSTNVNKTISATFLEDYYNYYDPQQMLNLATAMNNCVQVVETIEKSFRPYYTPDNSIDGAYQTDMAQLNKALSFCAEIQKYDLAPDWLKSKITSKKEELVSNYKECNEAKKMVDIVTENSMPRPSRSSSRGRDHFYSWSDFSFTVTNYSTENDIHYVVHAMKGGKLSGRFIKGYGSLKGAVLAGWAAATYGFARTQDSPRWTGGLLSGLLLQRMGKKWELDLYDARESDEVAGIIDSWIN